MMDPESSLTLRTETFVGPFDLLWDLIERQELNIADLPLASIAEQFLSYVLTHQWPDLETAAAFLVTAARLLRLKAAAVLPAGAGRAGAATDGIEDELDHWEGLVPGRPWASREDLVTRLNDYRRFRRVAEWLETRYATWRACYPRLPRSPAAPAVPASAPLWDADPRPFSRLGTPLLLVQAFTRALRDASGAVDPATCGASGRGRSAPSGLRRVSRAGAADGGSDAGSDGLPAYDLDVQGKVAELEALLAAMGGRLWFNAYAARMTTRSEVLAAFLAVLELVKLRRAQFVQPQPFGDLEVVCLPLSEAEGGIFPQRSGEEQ